ncbi:hypothetical protein HKX48_002815 [Thoreauomyces humboldtii]|nr:hypothetical protein HKX48_002815 [Thoreauomyces humboldtii]
MYAATKSRRSNNQVWVTATAAIAVASLIGTAYYHWAARRRTGAGAGGGQGGEMGRTNGTASNATRPTSPTDLTNALATAARTIWKGRRVITISMKNIYLITVVTSDEEEEQIRALLDASNLYAYGLDVRRVLFCSTEEGKAHVVRHVDPAVHVDSNDDVIARLAPFIRRIIRVKRTVLSESAAAKTGPSSNKHHQRLPSVGSAGKPQWPVLAGATGAMTTGSVGMNGRTASAPGAIGTAGGPSPLPSHHPAPSPLGLMLPHTPTSSAPMSRRSSSASGTGLSRTPTLVSLDQHDMDGPSRCSSSPLVAGTPVASSSSCSPPATADVAGPPSLLADMAKPKSNGCEESGVRRFAAFPNVECVESFDHSGLADKSPPSATTPLSSSAK